MMFEKMFGKKLCRVVEVINKCYTLFSKSLPGYGGNRMPNTYRYIKK